MKNDIKARFGNAVRAQRQKRSLSQEKLAEISGLHRTYISSLERGKRNVSLQNMEKLAGALECKISEFLGEV